MTIVGLCTPLLSIISFLIWEIQSVYIDLQNCIEKYCTLSFFFFSPMMTFSWWLRPAFIPICNSSYPKHAGEANPGPGPPCQSRGHRQRDGGHPDEVKKKKCHSGEEGEGGGGSSVSRQKSTVLPEIPGCSTQALAMQIHAGRGDVHRRWGEGTLLSFFPSLTALVSLPHLSSLPLSRLLALPLPLMLLLLCSLSLLFAHSLLPFPLSLLKCGNFIPWRKGGVGGGGVSLGLHFSSLSKLPSPQMILVSPSFPLFYLYLSQTHTHTYTQTLFIDHPPPPLASLRRIPHLSFPPPLLSCKHARSCLH